MYVDYVLIREYAHAWFQHNRKSTETLHSVLKKMSFQILRFRSNTTNSSDFKICFLYLTKTDFALNSTVIRVSYNNVLKWEFK